MMDHFSCVSTNSSHRVGLSSSQTGLEKVWIQSNSIPPMSWFDSNPKFDSIWFDTPALGTTEWILLQSTLDSFQMPLVRRNLEKKSSCFLNRKKLATSLPWLHYWVTGQKSSSCPNAAFRLIFAHDSKFDLIWPILLARLDLSEKVLAPEQPLDWVIFLDEVCVCVCVLYLTNTQNVYSCVQQFLSLEDVSKGIKGLSLYVSLPWGKKGGNLTGWKRNFLTKLKLLSLRSSFVRCISTKTPITSHFPISHARMEESSEAWTQCKHIRGKGGNVSLCAAQFPCPH